jgi:hypothetical protein
MNSPTSISALPPCVMASLSILSAPPILRAEIKAIWKLTQAHAPAKSSDRETPESESIAVAELPFLSLPTASVSTTNIALSIRDSELQFGG